MKPLQSESARRSALVLLADLRNYQGGDTYKGMVALLEAMLAEYQARLIDCPETEVPTLRIAARQVQALRQALAAEDLARVSLTL